MNKYYLKHEQECFIAPPGVARGSFKMLFSVSWCDEMNISQVY
jgi:hypothetical protein